MTGNKLPALLNVEGDEVAEVVENLKNDVSFDDKTGEVKTDKRAGK